MLSLLWGHSGAQCAFGGTLVSTLSPTGVGYTSSTAMRGGRYNLVNVCLGATYTFTTCGDTDFDTQITLFNDATTAVLGYSDDFAGCGAQSSITWIANFTGLVRVLVNQYNCATTGAAVLTTLIVNQTTACGSAVFPVNDACAGALPIVCGQTITGSTADASLETAVGTCGNSLSPTEWYSFVGTGLVTTMSLCGSGYDTYLSVLSGTCGALTCIAGNDDFAGCGLNSQLTFTAVLGTTYYIRVGGLGTSSGNYSLAATCTTASPNDACASAIPVVCGQTVAGSTTDATAEANVGTCGNATSPTEWYSFVGTGQNVVFSLCGSAFDTYISVLTGTCAGLTCIQGNDDFCGAQSQVVVPTTLGVTYYIRVGGWNTAAGNYSLAVTCIVPSTNDACSTAVAVVCGQTIAGSTIDATPEAVAVGCGNATSNSEWYSFVGTGLNTAVSLCGSAYDTQLGIFTGTCAALTCLVSNDDYCGVQSQIEFAATLGTTYFIRVSGTGTAFGNYTMTVTCVAPQPNDPCSGALPISCGQTVTGSTIGQSIDVIPAGCGVSNASGVWYTFVGNGDVITLNTCTGTAFDTQLSIFTGGCAGLSCISTNDQFCGDQSQIIFLSQNATTYWVLVHGYAETGAFSLSMACAPYVPSPQDCQGASSVCNDQQFNGNSSGTGTFQEINDANNGCLTIEHQSSWYVFSPITTGTLAFAINPTPLADYDFAVWGPYATAPCPPATDPIRCSFSALNTATGLGNGAVDFTEGAGGNAWVAPITIGPAELNQVYIMVLDNFSSTTTPFVFDWTLSGGLTLDCAIQLPVTYTAWGVEVKGNVNHLYWTTASEAMNEMFVIERSKDNVNFEYVGSVLGNGTTNQTHHYTYMDQKPFPGLSYYRLKQVDWNGANNFSTVIAIERASHFSLAPNPADEVLTVWLNQNDIGATYIELNDICGRMIVRLPVDTSERNTLEIPLDAFLSGTYLVTLRDKQGHVLQQSRLVVR